MGLKKDIKNLTQKMEKLEEILGSTTIYKAQQYDEISSLLKKIKFKAKTLKMVNENGDLGMIVKYDIPDVNLFFRNEELDWDNDLFYSINKLDLLDQESYDNITKTIQEIEKHNKNKKS